MITSFCQNQGWSVKTVSAIKENLLNKGYKSLTLKVRG